MKQEINLSSWNRKEHFEFFSKFEEPFFGITVNIDCTIAYDYTKQNNISLFLYYLYQSLKAANEVEAFKYRIINDKVFIYEKINASPTINRPDGTFGFAYMDYEKNENIFYKNAKQVIEIVKQSKGLKPATSGDNVIHFSAIPWINFTSLSHARSYSFKDSCPKISFGKIINENNKKSMNVAIHVHHALVDGYDVGLFIDKFQNLMNNTII